MDPSLQKEGVLQSKVTIRRIRHPEAKARRIEGTPTVRAVLVAKCTRGMQPEH